MAQMMGSTSAPVVVRLDWCEWGESRMGGQGRRGERTACVLVGEALDDDGSVCAGYADALVRFAGSAW